MLQVSAGLLSTGEKQVAKTSFGYPTSVAAERNLDTLCSALSKDPALFLKKVAAAFVIACLSGSENPQEKARTLLRAMSIENGNVTFQYDTRHPLLGNEFKFQVSNALVHYISTGRFLPSW